MVVITKCCYEQSLLTKRMGHCHVFLTLSVAVFLSVSAFSNNSFAIGCWLLFIFQLCSNDGISFYEACCIAAVVVVVAVVVVLVVLLLLLRLPWR